jgi:hypothetical protein
MHLRTAIAAAAALTVLLPLQAQVSREPEPLYKVEFNFRDGAENGVATDRRFTMLVNDSQKTVFRVGSKSPVSTGAQPQANGSPANVQFTYLDIGVNIECTVHGTGDRIGLHGNVDLSSIAPNDASPAIAGVRNPTVRQTKLDLDTALQLGKPTVVASIDDPLTSRKLQVEATVTRAN